MDNDLISRKALLEKFKSIGLGENSFIERVFADGVFVVIENAPDVDAEPVRHGEWVECMTYDEDGYYDIEYKCSECGRYEPFKQPYCHCGAKMDGGEKDVH